MREVKFFIIDQAREEFEKLNKVVGEQTARGIKNSEEMQLLNSIKRNSSKNTN